MGPGDPKLTKKPAMSNLDDESRGGSVRPGPSGSTDALVGKLDGNPSERVADET